MKFIRIPDANAHAVIDPGAYLEQLPHLARTLPEGARAFATGPDHYDFFGKRCVKDLKLAGLAFDNSGDETVIEILLRHNCWKHDDDLTIRYGGVHEIAVNLGMQSKWPRVDPPVILDEVLPHKHGCSHEIALHSGTIFIACRHLNATWTGADCPDKNPTESGGR